MSHPYVPQVILITGGLGFIASHVALLLHKKYPTYKFIIYDKLDYCASVHNLDAIKDSPNVMIVKGDIQSFDLVYHLITSQNVDTVMHFAAHTHVDNSFGNSLDFTMNNAYGTHVLLEACRAAGCIKRFVNVSTDEVYGETSLHSEEGLSENSILEPTNPYSAAKAAAEMICKAYQQSYKMPLIITRGNNVYGPHQYPEKLIPKFILLAQQKAKLPIHGNGNSIRSYLYVEDVANAFDIVLHKGVTGETYNIGTDQERSVTSVTRDICRAFNLSYDDYVTHVSDRAFNDRRYYIGYDKMKALGWEAYVTWEEGLRKTIDWYVGLENVDTYWQTPFNRI